MKVSLNWLKEYVHIGMAPPELAHLLTMAGLEVEGMEPVCQTLDNVVVGNVLSVRPHPNADRLSVCLVDTGAEILDVVCGAPNVAEGVLAPMALVGGRLPDGRIMKETRIRGAVSRGMLLAEDEMGLTDDHSGIMVLSPETPVGASLSAILDLPDWVLDVSITPNRPDCASVVGIAREIAAATGAVLRRPRIELRESGPPIEELTRVTIRDPVGCPRYAAGMIQNVEQGTAPFWMRYRLYQSGVRSINNLVDATNYVMLEMGQPLHAFDYHRLRENRIEVRRAKAGEAFTTLDGQPRRLTPETLMICDGERSVALAGIMGGLNSEIFSGTKDVLLESAFFDPVTIRRASKQLGLSTEASYRFERGVDVEGVVEALKRALSLISSLGGGTVATGMVDNYPRVLSPEVIRFRPREANRVLGTELSKDAMRGYLQALEMAVEEDAQAELRVTPPLFRVDIEREVDLVEEVARMNGFDRIPVTYPRIRPGEEGEAPELTLREHLRSTMVGIGFSEIITYSFISPESADILGADSQSELRAFTPLMNPLTVDQSVLRTSLLPGLMTTVRTNRLHDEKDLRLFEWGKTFHHREEERQPLEKNCLAAVMTGRAQPKQWYNTERVVDFYDMKGSVEALLKGTDIENLRFERGNAFPGYDPELSCGIYGSGIHIGQVGAASSQMRAAYDLKEAPVFLFELNIQRLMSVMGQEKQFRPLPKFPAVYRDISLVVDRQVESGSIVALIREEGEDLLESVHIFDIYEGSQIGDSEKAIAFRISYRSAHETLDGEFVNQLHDRIIRKICQETEGRLRER
ncbi:MAG: phenylalanine--tRNA ligase subunit beta [Thermodesulfobacteriota bacterium]